MTISSEYISGKLELEIWLLFDTKVGFNEFINYINVYVYVAIMKRNCFDNHNALAIIIIIIMV